METFTRIIKKLEKILCHYPKKIFVVLRRICSYLGGLFKWSPAFDPVVFLWIRMEIHKNLGIHQLRMFFKKCCISIYHSFQNLLVTKHIMYDGFGKGFTFKRRDILIIIYRKNCIAIDKWIANYINHLWVFKFVLIHNLFKQ